MSGYFERSAFGRWQDATRPGRPEATRRWQKHLKEIDYYARIRDWHGRTSGFTTAPELVRRGYEVLGLHTGFYKERMLYRDGATTPLTLAKDLRQIEAADLKGVDALVHMAELSNDPAGQLAPNITYEINHQGSVRLAQLAKRAGVNRFV